MSEAKLREYALKPVGMARVRDNGFVIEIIDNEIVSQSRCLYAFVLDDEVIRVGSTQGPLRIRMRAWERDVSRALQGLKSPTRQEEADYWREALNGGKFAKIFARMGTMAQTGVGMLNTYRLEEEALIGEFQPRLCWDRARYKSVRETG